MKNFTDQLRSIDQYLISFIVPVFNTRAYILEALNSIAAYGGDEIEIIVVDDGSTDDSIDIINTWANPCNISIKIVRQENAGLSQARMAGVKLATGSFIGFCDSDDKIDASVYLKMAKMALERNCDIAICRTTSFDDLTQKLHDFNDFRVLDGLLEGTRCKITNGINEPLLFMLEPSAPVRLVKRSFFFGNNFVFPSGLQFEDFPVHVRQMALANAVLLLNSTGYFYRLNRPGKITDQRSLKRFDILKSIEMAFNFTESIGNEGLVYVAAMACRMTYWCGAHTLNKDRKAFFTQACALLKKIVPQTVWDSYCSANFDNKERLIMGAFASNAINLLVEKSAGRRARLPSLLVLLLNRRHGLLARHIALHILKQKFRSFVRRVVKFFRF